MVIVVRVWRKIFSIPMKQLKKSWLRGHLSSCRPTGAAVLWTPMLPTPVQTSTFSFISSLSLQFSLAILLTIEILLSSLKSTMLGPVVWAMLTSTCSLALVAVSALCFPFYIVCFSEMTTTDFPMVDQWIIINSQVSSHPSCWDCQQHACLQCQLRNALVTSSIDATASVWVTFYSHSLLNAVVRFDIEGSQYWMDQASNRLALLCCHS